MRSRYGEIIYKSCTPLLLQTDFETTHIKKKINTVIFFPQGSLKKYNQCQLDNVKEILLPIAY